MDGMGEEREGSEDSVTVGGIGVREGKGRS